MNRFIETTILLTISRLRYDWNTSIAWITSATFVHRDDTKFILFAWRKIGYGSFRLTTRNLDRWLPTTEFASGFNNVFLDRRTAIRSGRCPLKIDVIFVPIGCLRFSWFVGPI